MASSNNMQGNKPRMHHFLIAAELVFRRKGEEAIMSVRSNGVLISDNRDLPARSIGKAQQIVQMNFHGKMQDPEMEILDVVILNLPYLGHMTQEEYERQPKTPTMQQAGEVLEMLKKDE